VVSFGAPKRLNAEAGAAAVPAIEKMNILTKNENKLGADAFLSLLAPRFPNSPPAGAGHESVSGIGTDSHISLAVVVLVFVASLFPPNENAPSGEGAAGVVDDVAAVVVVSGFFPNSPPPSCVVPEPVVVLEAAGFGVVSAGFEPKSPPDVEPEQNITYKFQN
jgi:hypothetical protein